MMRGYQETLLEAARALVADGDLEMRLSQVACVLIELDDGDVPPRSLEAFEAVRDPLIAKPLVVEGLLVPRNQIYKDAGFCFKTSRAIAAFGNAGCRYDELRDVPLSERDRGVVGRYVREETILGCRP